MTTGNDTALPATDNEPSAEAAALAQQQQQQPNAPLNVDDAELNAAKALATAEEAGGQGSEQTGNQSQQDPAQQTGAQPVAAAAEGNQQQPQQQPPMVPIARLNEALRVADEARLTAARLQGQLEATRQAAPQPGQQQQQPQQQQPPEQRLAAVNAGIDALADRFDAGELTMKDFKTEERKLQDQAQAIRDEQSAAHRQAANPPPPQANDELYLESLTAKLEQQHPWVVVFDQVGTDADWALLKDRALENLKTKGIDPTKPAGRYEFRREMSEIADQLGPSLIADRAKAKGITLPTGQQSQQPAQQQQPNGGPRPLSPTAQARAAAIAKAGDAPPDISAMPGYGANPSELPTEGSLEVMNDDDIGKLPTAVRNRLLGISPS